MSIAVTAADSRRACRLNAVKTLNFPHDFQIPTTLSTIPYGYGGQT